MLNSRRIAIAGLASMAGIGAALTAQGAKVVEAVRPTRESSGIRSVANARRASAPRLKKPKTAHDHAMVAKAQAKRARKGVKLRRDEILRDLGQKTAYNFILLRARTLRSNAFVRNEAASVARELEAEQLA